MRYRLWLVSAMLLIAIGVPVRADAKVESAEGVATGFIQHLEAGAYDKAWAGMSPEVREALSLDALKQTWEALPAQLGKYESRGSVQTSKSGALTLVTIPLLFANGNLDAAIAVDTSGKIVGLHFQPPPATRNKQSAVDTTERSGVASEVTIGKGDGVPGTLLMPPQAHETPVPVLLLVPGSGPQDRDGTVGRNRPYADIARGLASLGVASLRFDKRTLVRPDEFRSADFTLDDEVGNDVAAALERLATTPGIDPKRIYLFGHSLGGLAAIRVAEAPSVAGLILFAVPSRPILDLLVDQAEYIANADGNVSHDEVEANRKLKEQVLRVRSGDMEASILGAPAHYWADLEQRDVIAGVIGLRKPILMLQGERDYQVTRADWKIWRERTAATSGITLRDYPTLNHLGVSGSAPSTPAEYLSPGHVDPGLIREIADWIRMQPAARPR